MSRSRLVARNVFVTLITQIISWALTFAVTLFLPRYVGVVGMGKLTFAIAFVSIFSVFVPLGTSTILVKEIARDRSRTTELLSAALLSRLPLGFSVTGLAIGIMRVLHRPHLDLLLVLVASIGMIIGSLNDALGSALQGQENISRSSGLALIDKFLSTILVLGLLVVLGKRSLPLWLLSGTGLVSGTISLLLNLSGFRSLWRNFHWPEFKTIRSLILAGMPFFGITMFRTIYNQADATLLSFMTNDHTVGWYGVAGRLLGSTLFIPVALATALLPSLTRLNIDSETKFVEAIRRALGLVILCVIPIAVPFILLPRQILFQFLHYPLSFSGSAPILAIYGFGIIFWYVTQIIGTALIVQDRQDAMCRISLVAMALTVGGCLVAIPTAQKLWGNGGIGAALIDVGVEIYMVCAFVRALPRGLFEWTSQQKILTKALLAVVPMVLMTAIAHLPWLRWSSLCAGLLIYGILCYSLGCFTKQDIALFQSVFIKQQPA